jgi:hypothetical protein
MGSAFGWVCAVFGIMLLVSGVILDIIFNQFAPSIMCLMFGIGFLGGGMIVIARHI